MHFRHWMDIKSCLKQNKYWSEKNRTDESYDPTQKYYLMQEVMTYNMNVIIKRGGLDVTHDETTWQNASYTELHS